MKLLRALAGALLLSSTGASYLHAQTLPPFPQTQRKEQAPRFSFDRKVEAGGEVNIEIATNARTEYVRDEYVLIDGGFKITYQDVVISGDKLTHNLKTKDVTAEGNVIVDQGPQRLSGDRAVFNLTSKTGTVFNARGFFEGSAFSGEKIEKTDEVTYRLTNGVFTSCDLDDPAWAFHLGSGVVTVNDYARLRNLSFRAKRVPVLYTPYIIWPTKQDRARGLLIPKVGANNRFGFYLGNAYFIPFGQSADSTIFADYYSKGYYGAGTEVRYKPQQDMAGKFQGHLVRDPENDTIEWKYDYEHTQENLPGGFRGVIDVQDFSDLEFFQTYSRDFNLNTISNIYSSAYLTKNKPDYSLNIRADRRKHFLGTDQSQVFEQLPTIDFKTYPNRLGRSPFYLALESSLGHLRTSLGANYYRADLFPTISMQLRTPSWISIKPQISARETYYTSSLDPLDPSRRTITDEALTRSYAQGQVEVVGPSFSKIFRRDMGGFNRFKHVIEPRVRYLYTTGVEDQDRVIQFDITDSPYLPLVEDSIEYSLTQRLLAKEAREGSGAREIVTLTFRQTAALSEPFNQTEGPSRDSDRFTPLLISANVNPYQSFSVNVNATFGNVSHQLDQTSLSANLRGPDGSYLQMTWFASFLAPGRTTGDSSQFRVSAATPSWRNRIRGAVQLNYDAERGELLEHRYLVDTTASCYSVALEYRDFQVFRSSGPEQNRDYTLSISLKNVGTFVDLRGSLDRD
jgi:LPS-assembly protein